MEGSLATQMKTAEPQCSEGGGAAWIAAEGEAIRECKWLKEASQYTGLIDRLKISVVKKKTKQKRIQRQAEDPSLCSLSLLRCDLRVRSENDQGHSDHLCTSFNFGCQ